MSYDPYQQPQPYGGMTLAPPPPPRKSHRTRNIILGVLGALVLIIVIVVATSKSPNGTPSASSTSNPPAAANNNAATTPPPATQTSTAPPSPAAPAMTVSQQQAVASAQQYLQDEPGFSYQGLIGQLDSSAEGFSVADATFAVNYLHPASDEAFWDAQAVDSAKSYMQTEPGWSACGLEQQLDSSADQYTQAEAAYAVQQVGLGAC